jgi:hypothetical protein
VSPHFVMTLFCTREVIPHHHHFLDITPVIVIFFEVHNIFVESRVFEKIILCIRKKNMTADLILLRDECYTFF